MTFEKRYTYTIVYYTTILLSLFTYNYLTQNTAIVTKTIANPSRDRGIISSISMLSLSFSTKLFVYLNVVNNKKITIKKFKKIASSKFKKKLKWHIQNKKKNVTANASFITFAFNVQNNPKSSLKYQRANEN